MMIKKTREIFFLLALVWGATAAPLSASVLDSSGASERAGFFVRDLKICHQGEWRNLTVNLEYESEVNGSAMNIQNVRNHVKNFLEDFPNTTDFWEIMNTKLVTSLFGEFPDIISLKSVLSLAPDRTLLFPRESTVQYEKNNPFLKESFKFTKINYLICNESFRSLDLHVAFDIKENPGPFDYPDYLWVDGAMEEFFSQDSISISKWSNLKPQVEAFLLTRFPTLTSMRIDITIAD